MKLNLTNPINEYEGQGDCPLRDSEVVVNKLYGLTFGSHKDKAFVLVAELQ